MKVLLMKKVSRIVLIISLIVIGVMIVGWISYGIIKNYGKVEIKLDKCIDGDTAWFIVEGKKEKVRLLGIDTPESTNYVEEYGKEASNYTCSMLENATNIYLAFDSNSDRYDKYDRLLGYVFVDGNNLSELLLLEGLAEVKYIYGEYKYIDSLCKSQYEAYREKLGIWNMYDYTKNYCYDKMN